MKKQSCASLNRKVKSLSKRLGNDDEDYYKKLYLVLSSCLVLSCLA